MDFSSILQGAQIGSFGVASLSGLRSLFGPSLATQVRYQKDLMKYQNELAFDLYSRQNDVQLSNWNLQNEYNSPIQQLARYREAGLNPNLIYGGSGAVAGNAESAGSSPGGMPSVDLAGVRSTMQRQLDLQTQQNFANLANSFADVDLKRAQARNLDVQTYEFSPTADMQRDLWAQMIAESKEQAQVLKYDGLYKDQALNFFKDSYNLNLESIGLANESARQEIAISLYKLQNIIPLEKEQLEVLVKQKLPAEVKELMSRTGLNYAQAECCIANAALAASQKLLTDQQTDVSKRLNTDSYLQNLRATAYHTALYYKSESSYLDQKTYSDKMGYPYIISLHTSDSNSSGFGPVNTSYGSSFSSVMNPVNGPQLNLNIPKNYFKFRR